MAKWGAFKYGTSTKYGTGDAGTQPTFTGDYIWTLAVDWGSGWVNEAGRCVGMKGNRGRHLYVGKGADTFEHCQPGRFTFDLENSDRRYDPYNSSSPLYGSIEPGKPVWLRVKYDHVSYPVFRGTITDIRPIYGTNRVQMICDDYLQWLSDQDITYTTSSANQDVKVDALISAVLQQAKYPYPTSIAGSNCPVTYFSVKEENALDTIRQLCDAGIGTAYCDADGTFRYLDLSSSGLTNHTLTQDMLLKQVAISQPWENVRNKITCIANRYGYSALEEMWRSDEPIYVAAGGTTTLKIEFEECAVIQPVKGVDYMDDARPIVSGGVISWGNYFDASLSAITSTTANLNIHNSDPSSAQWLAWIAIRGNKLVNKKISFSATDETSAAKGPKRFKIDSPYLQDRSFAEAYTTLLLAHLKDPSKNPIIQLETRGDGLGIDLFHTVTLDIDARDIDETFDVGGMDWEWIPTSNGVTNGQAFRQTIYLQNVLHSSTTITPQPFKPGLPAVPVNPGPGGPGGTTTNPGEGGPTYQQTMACLDDLVAQGANGPYTTGQNTVISNETGLTSYNAGLWFRTQYNPHRTWVTIDGTWQSLVNGAWVNDASWDFDSINAYDITGRQIFTGGLSSGGAVADGVRWYYWGNTLKYYVRNIAFGFSTLGRTFTVKSPVYSGTVNANSATGVQVSGLAIGSYYALTSSGSFVVNGQNCYDMIAASDSGYSNRCQFGFTLDGVYADDSGGNTWIVVDHLDNLHGTLFFKAAASSLWIRLGGNALGAGSMGYSLANAEPAGGTKRVIVRSVNYYNVCQGASGGPM